MKANYKFQSSYLCASLQAHVISSIMGPDTVLSLVQGEPPKPDTLGPDWSRNREFSEPRAVSILRDQNTQIIHRKTMC
jgi:hypothetical protein